MYGAPTPDATLDPVALPSWLTVRLGVHKTAAAYVAALQRDLIRIDGFARQILEGMEIAPEERELELFLGTARDFGFRRDAPREHLFERAALLGYVPCPAEVGPAAIDHVRTSRREEPRIAMEPVAFAPDRLEVFHLTHFNCIVRLSTSSARGVSPDEVWAWCRRQS